jgi:hypothetical protein
MAVPALADNVCWSGVHGHIVLCVGCGRGYYHASSFED